MLHLNQVESQLIVIVGDLNLCCSSRGLAKSQTFFQSLRQECERHWISRNEALPLWNESLLAKSQRERERERECAAGVGYGWAESRVASRNECEKKAASHSIEVIVTSCQRSLTFWNRLRFDGHCPRFEVCNYLSEATTVEEAACKSRLNAASRKARFRTLEHMPNLCLKQPSKYFHKLQPRSQKAVKLTFSWALLRCASSWSQRL